jgi:hypothetical protein
VPNCSSANSFESSLSLGLVLRFSQEGSEAPKILLMYELFNELVHVSLPREGRENVHVDEGDDCTGLLNPADLKKMLPSTSSAPPQRTAR